MPAPNAAGGGDGGGGETETEARRRAAPRLLGRGRRAPPTAVRGRARVGRRRSDAGPGLPDRRARREARARRPRPRRQVHPGGRPLPPERNPIERATGAGAGGGGDAAAGPMGRPPHHPPVSRDAGPTSGRNRMGGGGIPMDGDFSAFEQHLDALYRSALRLTRKPEDAQDLVQETYLRAFRYRNRFKPGTNEKAWLFTIMANAFRNRGRQHRVIEEPIDEPANDHFIYDQLRREGLPLHLMSPEEVIVDRGLGVEVRRALEDLPLPMRMVVILVDVEEFSYKEVAQILGIKIGTVMSRLHRGRRALQKRLWDYAERPKARRVAMATP